MSIETSVCKALASGCSSGAEIRLATGLTHEAVYTALVWLEARGLAYLTCRKGPDGRVAKDWSV